jgi:apolipoprotein N-acyltransferase
MATTLRRPAKPASPESRGEGKPAPSAPTFARTLAIAMLGSSLLWLAFPPVGFWPLAWLAPLPWLWLMGQPQPLGRKGYWAIWLASLAFWAALLFGVSLAHEALIAGWLILAAYLAVYLPLAVGMTRMLVHLWRWPLALAAPVVWVGLEYARSYMVTGFSLAMLAQSQVEFPLILQTADIFGAYGPSFLMMLVAASAITWFTRANPRVRFGATAVAALALLAALGYGSYRMQQPTAEGPALRVMLVQGCQDTKLDGDPSRAARMDEEYRRLTFEGLTEHEPCDLVVWPESAFVEAELCVPDMKRMPADFAEESYRRSCEDYDRLLTAFAERLNEKSPGRTHWVAGSNRVEFSDDGVTVYNAAFHISPEGKLTERYFKNHLVLCGEYMPLGEWLPWIYKLTPIQPVTRGREFKSFSIAGLRLAPNICFESLVSQLLVRQHNELTARGEEPDVLLNTTNDGWFYGSAILDLHFQCAVLRAIENRKPFLIAANTGVSGVIDGNGRVQQRGPNHATAILVAEVSADGRQSWYHTLGDWPAGVSFLVSGAAVMWGMRRRRITGDM